MVVTILIADDYRPLRSLIRSFLCEEPDFCILGEAADGDEALRLAGQLRPQVLLADISMPGPSGLDVARLLHPQVPETRVLILTMHEDPYLVQEARAAQAAGFVIKRHASRDLPEAIRCVAGGGAWWPDAEG